MTSPTTAAAPSGTSARSCWPPRDEIDGETEHLVYLADDGWCWEWPGWKWVATTLNGEYGNNRTPEACRAKYNRIMRKANKGIDRKAVRE